MSSRIPASYYLPLWEAAYEEEIGIKIECDPKTQRQLVRDLYECRQESGDERFEEMILFQPNPKGTIFIAHKSAELP